jgi:hypothetical protein
MDIDPELRARYRIAAEIMWMLIFMIILWFIPEPRHITWSVVVLILKVINLLLWLNLIRRFGLDLFRDD